MSDWKPIETAPIDEWVLIAATPDHVGQGIVYDDADINGNGSDARRYEWSGSGPFHPNIKPTHWMPLPLHPDAAQPGTVRYECRGRNPATGELVGVWFPVSEKGAERARAIGYEVRATPQTPAGADHA